MPGIMNIIHQIAEDYFFTALVLLTMAGLVTAWSVSKYRRGVTSGRVALRLLLLFIIGVTVFSLISIRSDLADRKARQEKVSPHYMTVTDADGNIEIYETP